MKCKALLILAICLCAGRAWSAERYFVTGIVLKVDRPHRSFIASCEAIPGYMEAMSMPYSVQQEEELDRIKPGLPVEFTLVVAGGDSHAEDVRVHINQSVEQEPLRARRLQLLEEIENAKTVPVGIALQQQVPDFVLTDQTGKRVALSEFAGKVVALTFIYTSCPLPDYCFRLSNNFGLLKRRFANRMGKDLTLLSVTFDPARDQPEVLAHYAATWKADATSWHFLTGSLTDIKALCRLFGLNFWQDEGVLTHSLRTVVIDRRGRLAAIVEGNQFTAEQLGDLVESTLDRAQ